MKKPKAIIFDMDGVLLDSESLTRDVFLNSCREHGFEIPLAVFLKMVGRNQIDSRLLVEDYAGKDFPWDSVCSQVSARTGILTNEEGWPKKPQVEVVLESLKQLGIRLCVATSTARKVADQRLVSASIRDYFEEISGGDEVQFGKPNPELFLLALKRLGITNEECLVIEDSEFGILAASEAGIRSILVPDLKQPSAQTAALTLGVFDDLLSVLEFVKRL